MIAQHARGAVYALIACFAGAVHGAAADVAEQTTMGLRISEQPLDEALQEFSRQSGVQVIFFSRITDGVRSPGANGKFTIENALEALLAGSGLSFRVINPRTVEIFRPEPARALGCCNE
jgi:iron complex outermembrane receptor protein